MSLTKRQLVFGLVVSVITLTGLVLVLAGSDTVAAVGTSLIASGIVGILELVYRAIIAEENPAAVAITRAGVSAIHDRRDIDKYHSLMSNLSSRLDICGYSLRGFYESFRETLRSALDEHPSLHVRILLVDPKSEHSREREAAEGHADGTFVASIAKIRQDLSDRANVDIRFVSDAITTMVFRMDSVMFVGPQFISVPSKATPTIELKAQESAWLFQSFEKEFDQMWDTARSEL